MRPAARVASPDPVELLHGLQVGSEVLRRELAAGTCDAERARFQAIALRADAERLVLALGGDR